MFSNKVVLITGAGSGIGMDSALCFLRNGACVIACDINEKGLDSLRVQAKELADKLELVCFDISDTGSFGGAAGAVAKHDRLDVLVNCAGICSGTKLDDISEAEWDRTYCINVRGPFFLTRLLLPYLKKSCGAAIVNISSMAGFTGGIMSNPAYSSSKAAVTCMTKNLAKFCAPMGIRVNEVSPGTARTNMTLNWLGSEGLKGFVDKVPLGRLAEAQDIAKAVLFLASENADFITGQSLQVNGGMYIP